MYVQTAHGVLNQARYQKHAIQQLNCHTLSSGRAGDTDLGILLGAKEPADGDTSRICQKKYRRQSAGKAVPPRELLKTSA